VKMIWIIWTHQHQPNQVKATTGTKIHAHAAVVGGVQKNQAMLPETATTTGLNNVNARIAPVNARIAPGGMKRTMILDRKSVPETQKKQRTRTGQDHALDGVDDVVGVEVGNVGKTERETKDQHPRRIPTTILC